jgi:hypothetical protein
MNKSSAFGKRGMFGKREEILSRGTKRIAWCGYSARYK